MIRTLQSIREATRVSVVQHASSPYMLTGTFISPSTAVCISQFSPVSGNMLAPFRGTFKGTIAELENPDVTAQGNPKRVFKLVDTMGAYIMCCALVQNAASVALVERQQVVFYFATGRGPIGSFPGMLYCMKDCVIMPQGLKFLPQVQRTHIPIINAQD